MYLPTSERIEVKISRMRFPYNQDSKSGEEGGERSPKLSGLRRIIKPDARV